MSDNPLAALAMRERAAEMIETHVLETQYDGSRVVVPSNLAKEDQHHRSLANAIRAIPTTFTDAEMLAAAMQLPEVRALVETAEAWQPIETAPNIRGVRIIGWCVFPAGAEAREVKGYIPLDRMEDAVKWFYGSVLQNVTHWMPLPPPPKGTPHE
jgi:hypothetical protein